MHYVDFAQSMAESFDGAVPEKKNALSSLKRNYESLTFTLTLINYATHSHLTNKHTYIHNGLTECQIKDYEIKHPHVYAK